MRILHRDIKPANVFITSTKHIIIGDYGVARAWLEPFYANFPSSSLKARDAPGTMFYLAPEVVKGFYQDQVNFEVGKYANYGFEADIWSLGVTICDSWCQSRGLFGLQEEEKHLDIRRVVPSKILQMDVQPVVKRIVNSHPIWHLIARVSIHSLSWGGSGNNHWCVDVG
ncbi:kinase-like protein [Thelephora ganbajun]|uniref:Kinase-like protein n=1 Tax=Thelephora ganbajun TaxID=370292 RepID=A0ACB6ZER4_THEGA|nr:kinase-like protein [Thelephora ganbajun]